MLLLERLMVVRDARVNQLPREVDAMPRDAALRHRSGPRPEDRAWSIQHTKVICAQDYFLGISWSASII